MIIRKDWLIISIFTLITVIAWVVFDIIHSRSQVEIPTEIKNVLDPINPNFDTDVFKNVP